MRIKVVTAILAASLVILLVVSYINGIEISSSFLLAENQTLSANDYDGAVMELEGFIVRLPLRVYYIRGTATINDEVWKMARLKGREPLYVMELVRVSSHGTINAFFSFQMASGQPLFSISPTLSIAGTGIYRALLE